ncbi:ecm29p [Saccharomyces arboricola H-6]|uniref:Ecm29p n=1 Tax=Saccharomyces arboricola (strain H-6 / AS 2.3317 / CBS 10644) TaxID=1160507 RepID=J8Q7C5_SACAR|nr:ecm29p [Saccharomyces arboricola H-6]
MSMSSDETKEKQLVEKVELRLAIADSPQKFETNLQTFLPPLLLKLASPHASVRTAVFSALKNIISRINTLPQVQLPVRALIAQAKEPNLAAHQDSTNVRLYSLLLASKGIDRLSLQDRQQLLPLVVSNIQGLTGTVAARMFHILLKLILEWVAPQDSSHEQEEFVQFLQLDDDGFTFLMRQFTNFFLLVPSKQPQTSQQPLSRGYTCPGLSLADVAFFTYDAGVTFNKDQLHRFKNAIFQFVCHGMAAAQTLEQSPKVIELMKFLCVVSTDATALSDSATQFMKRFAMPYENEEFVTFLQSLYIGDNARGRPPVKTILQEKILSILNKSQFATTGPESISLICSIGLHSSEYKLRSLTLSFIRHVAELNYQNLHPSSSSPSSTDFSTSIVSLIRNNLHAEGWPKLQLGPQTPAFNTAILQRQLQYETLGDILKRDFDLVSDLSYIEFLFESLQNDLPQFRSSIQDSLLSLVGHLSKLPSQSKSTLKALLGKNLSIDEQEQKDSADIINSIMALKFVSIKFTNAAFPFHDPEARLYNLWGTVRTNRFDIIEESFKGLQPFWFRINNASLNTSTTVKTSQLLGSQLSETMFPQFKEFLRIFINQLDSESAAITRKSLNNIVRFIKQCLISNAIYGKKTMVIQDEDWSIRIDKALELDDTVVSQVGGMVQEMDDDILIRFLTLLSNEFVTTDSNGKQVAIFPYQDPVFGSVLSTLLKFVNSNVLQKLENLVSNLYHLLITKFQSLSENDLEVGASIIGIISTAIVDSDDIKRIMNVVESQTLAETYIASYVVPRLYLKDQTTYIQDSSIVNLLNNLVAHLSHSTTAKNMILKLICQVTKFGLPLQVNSQARKEFLTQIMDTIQDKLINDVTAVQVWSYLSLYSNDLDNFSAFQEKLLETHASKQNDFLFSVGESLTVLAGKWSSKYLIKQIDIPNFDVTTMQQKFPATNVTTVLNQILSGCDSTKPSLRRASCIWLLSYIQYLGHLSEVSSKCSDIHLRFMRFLADRDDFIQDSAARGLSLVYEIGGADLKESMVKGLLKSFTDSTVGAVSTSATSISGSVSEETELFEPGVLNTGDGSISTYKDILNLASEVGDPALVYKFMSLAKSSALWSSRKGIAFGLGAIMSKSSLEELLVKDQDTAKKLIPKLYRYKFDPFQAVSRSMTDIWNTLISDSSTTISLYFNAILEELLSGMASKEWRVREASTSALLQLIQSQPQEKFSDHMLKIWTMAFRTMDDIKDSVREAGTKFTTVLAKILAKSIDVEKGVNPTKSKEILDNILPFLLGPHGLNSDAEEVRNFALTTLIDLVKNSPGAIKPFTPGLIYDFITLFSSIEPQVINYLALNAANYNIDANVIDIQRKNGVTSSPLFQTIEKLISKSDDTMMEDIINVVIKATKKSVGLPSKVASSLVIILLVKRYSTQMRAYSGKLLKVCLIMFEDRNESINIAFAIAMGYVFKVSALDKCIKYSEKLMAKYFEPTSTENNKKIVGTAIDSILNYARPEFDNVASIFMPLIFIACNDEDKDLETLYNKVWTEASSSGAGTVKLYLPEILNILSTNIKSNDFSIRKICAKSVIQLCGTIDDNIPHLQIVKLFDISKEALNGRSWDGKEHIVGAVVSLAEKFSQTMIDDSSLQDSINDVMKTEVSRKSMKYVKKILPLYAKYVSVNPQDAMITLLIEKSREMIRSLGNESDDDDLARQVSDESTIKRIKPNTEITQKSSKQNVENEEYFINLLKATVDICNNSKSKYPMNLLEFVIDEIAYLFHNDRIIHTWRTQLAASEIGISIVSKFNTIGSTDFIQNVGKLWSQIFKINCNKETIENVKLQMIKLGGLIIQKIPSLKNNVEENLRLLNATDSTSRIELELRNIGL